MKRLAFAFAVPALLTACGGAKKSSEPLTALLTGVQVTGTTVSFDFDQAPRRVKARYVARSGLAECGSGLRVALKGTAYAIVHFLPARTARIEGDTVTPTYTGPKRIEGPGPVRETVKVCDFESDVGWAIGVERRLPLHVSQQGSTVTVGFG